MQVPAEASLFCMNYTPFVECLLISANYKGGKMRRDLKNEIYELDSIMESNLRLLKADQAVTAENKQNILDFIDDSKSRGLSQNRIILSLQHLRRLSRFTLKE